MGMALWPMWTAPPNVAHLPIRRVFFSKLFFPGNFRVRPPAGPPSQAPLLSEPTRLTEWEHSSPWRELQRSSWPAPCLQAGPPVNRPRQSLPRAGPSAPSARSGQVKFCADSVERCRRQRAHRQLRRESLVERSDVRGPEGLCQLIPFPLWQHQLSQMQPSSR